MAACAQIVGPIRSVYRWDGRVQDDPEYQVWFKAPADRFEDIRDYILGAHTYDTPEVIQLPITAGSAAYPAWLTDETKPRPRSRSSARNRADRPSDASSVSRSPTGFVG